jgi:hypothetical protein
MENISFKNTSIKVTYGGAHAVNRVMDPIEGATEASIILGNAKTGFLEIKSNADVAMDQLTMIKKDGKRIDLFNPEPENNVSQSREFHKAFKNNTSLNSSQYNETVYFNAIDPETKEKVRLCVNPQGFYHVNEKGGIDRSRRINYEKMDAFCEATKAHAKNLNLNFYTKQEPTYNEHVNFTNILKASELPQRVSSDQEKSINNKYIIPQKKTSTKICAIL